METLEMEKRSIVLYAFQVNLLQNPLANQFAQMQTLHKALIFVAVIFLCVPGSIHGFGINIASIPSLRSSPASVSKHPNFATSPLTPQVLADIVPLVPRVDDLQLGHDPFSACLCALLSLCAHTVTL